MIAPAPSERTWFRVELVSMDGQCADISIALYRQETETGPVGIVHTYSRVAGAQERVAFVAGAMRTLGGLAQVGDDPATIVVHLRHVASRDRAPAVSRGGQGRPDVAGRGAARSSCSIARPARP